MVCGIGFRQKMGIVFALLMVSSCDASAYLDPGTGSLLIQALLASFIGILFTLKIYWRRIRQALSSLSKKK
ncbi:hypothetical protein ACFLRF_01985 [Candidatus Altiarchaeota archaeon]